MAAISTALIATAGVGLSAYGASQTMAGARASAAATQRQIQEELRAEALRKQAMELDARRKQMEMLRNRQRARAMALTSATAQGAAQGSGLQGGYGQISGQSNVNLLGVDQQIGIGNAMFGINQNISQARMGIAAGQAQMQQGGALTGLGGTIISNLGTIKSLSGGFGAGANASSWGSPSSSSYGYTGYGGLH